MELFLQISLFHPLRSSAEEDEKGPEMYDEKYDNLQ